LDYSFNIPVIVIVIVALAEELLALLIVLVTSLAETLALGIETTVSINPIRTNAANRIARIIKNSFFTSSQFNYITWD